MSHRFFIVDVFAERPYCGNPLAVVVGADDLGDATREQIAAEMNFSETAFIESTPANDGSWRVRFFTPAREVAFAGHPILGAAWVIHRYVDPAADAVLSLRLALGQVRVDFERDSEATELTWFVAPPISLSAMVPTAPIAAALGLAPKDLEPALPVRQVCAGTSALLVAVRSADALRRARLDLASFAPLAAEGLAPLVYVFCREPRDPANHLRARFFFEAHGVREDPATGNAAAFLGAYLREHRWFGGSDLSLRIEQGEELLRPSLVRLQTRGGATPEIRVGGQVAAVVRGELL